ncbi:MAG: hypothetical protein ABEH88_06790 [Halobacteriales archaeon]
MERSTATRIEEWDRREVHDGRTGLSRLGDVEFSGAVDAGGAWLFMLNGRIVGTSGGSVDGVGAADPLTAYTAPHPSLPLLFAMQERDGEPQGRYFTDDTALAEVHDTLSSGSFTGYVELSEKVHSGDYYVVYYGGRALFVAFVGTSERLVTGEDAFERANDEVGIYEIYPVDLEVQDPPEPVADVGDGPETAGDSTVDPGAGSRDQGPDASQGQAGEREPSNEETEEDGEAGDVGTKADDIDAEPDSPDPNAPGDKSPEDRTEAGTPETGSDRDKPTRIDRDEVPKASSREDDGGRQPTSTGEKQPTSTGGLLGPDRDGVPWDDGQTVPALDPERTAVPTGGADAGRETGPDSDAGSSGREREPTSETGRTEPRTGGDSQADDVTADRVAELEAEVDALRDRVESLSAERDQLAENRERMTRGGGESESGAESESSGEVESTGKFLAEQTGGEESLSRRKAFAETDVFVRYDSRSRPTLADAHGGDGSLEAVSENRQLEIHTRFDASSVTVDGEPLESFLQDTLAYRFVAWLTGEFLFEIRDSGNETALRDLYDAIPKIDRAEFDETVDRRGEGGDERGTVFDIVFRSKTGEPLFLVDIDEGRDPTHGRLMSELIDRSGHVVEAGRSVAGVFLITASFFDAEAHETVREATKSGLFDRDSRASFVKTSRNDGYHACLVEARDDGFHLSRPDL